MSTKSDCPNQSTTSIRHTHIINQDSVVWLDQPNSPTYRSRALLLQLPLLANESWDSLPLQGGDWKIGDRKAVCQLWDSGNDDGFRGTVWHGVYQRHALPWELEFLSLRDRQCIPPEEWESLLSHLPKGHEVQLVGAVGGGPPQPNEAQSSSTSPDRKELIHYLVEDILRRDTLRIPVALIYFDRPGFESLHSARMSHMWLGYRQNLLVINRDGTLMLPEDENVPTLERALIADNGRDAWRADVDEQERGLEALVNDLRALELAVSESQSSGRKKQRIGQSIGPHHGALVSPESRINDIPSPSSASDARQDEPIASTHRGRSLAESLTFEDSDGASSVQFG
ncbi:hypothetical protein M407DRAFT_17893 [Tulasnella calospora MUT 4182]|uniref:Uncharacterized protein n=1 Tax=Tulasnella calospora MUT 4182 TaxID=1051891 RepID=A0A0C3LHB5_9AGAM|nr:hypothetical protein M407DRAFT_17893 [Tulasnella calospora MUT 4182]